MCEHRITQVHHVSLGELTAARAAASRKVRKPTVTGFWQPPNMHMKIMESAFKLGATIQTLPKTELSFAKRLHRSTGEQLFVVGLRNDSQPTHDNLNFFHDKTTLQKRDIQQKKQLHP